MSTISATACGTCSRIARNRRLGLRAPRTAKHAVKRNQPKRRRACDRATAQ